MAKALVWIHVVDEKTAHLREVGMFTPENLVVEIEYKPGVTTNDQAFELARNASIQAAQIILKPIDFKSGELQTVTGFKAGVALGIYTDDDGAGHYATRTHQGSAIVDLSDIVPPIWATHIVWYSE